MFRLSRFHLSPVNKPFLHQSSSVRFARHSVRSSEIAPEDPLSFDSFQRMCFAQPVRMDSSTDGTFQRVMKANSEIPDPKLRLLFDTATVSLFNHLPDEHPHKASKKSQGGIIELPGEPPRKKLQALYTAAKTNDIETVRAFMKDYPKDEVGLIFALKFAAQNGHLPIVKLILEKFADALEREPNGHLSHQVAQAFKEAAKHGQTHVVKEILPQLSRLHERGYSDKEYLIFIKLGFNSAAKHGDLQSLRMILHCITRMNNHDYRLQCLGEAMTGAATYRRPEVIKFLLPDFRALKDNSPKATNYLCEALESAALVGQSEIIQQLLPDFNALNQIVSATQHKKAYAYSLCKITSNAVNSTWHKDKSKRLDPKVTKLLIDDFFTLMEQAQMNSIDLPKGFSNTFDDIRYYAKRTGRLPLYVSARIRDLNASFAELKRHHSNL